MSITKRSRGRGNSHFWAHCTSFFLQKHISHLREEISQGSWSIPVQRNQHYFSQSTFTYIISFILSITQYGFLHFTGNKPKVSVTWPRSRRRLPGFPPLRTTFCNTICAPEAGYAPSIVVRNVFDPPILTPYFHENLMDLEKVWTRARTYFGTNIYIYMSSDNLE